MCFTKSFNYKSNPFSDDFISSAQLKYIFQYQCCYHLYISHMSQIYRVYPYPIFHTLLISTSISIVFFVHGSDISCCYLDWEILSTPHTWQWGPLQMVCVHHGDFSMIPQELAKGHHNSVCPKPSL